MRAGAHHHSSLNCPCKLAKHPVVVEGVTQGLSGGERVNGGKPHDDLVHEWDILHPLKTYLDY